MTQYVPDGKIMAFFVGGPNNGATEFLDKDFQTCYKAKRDTISKLISLGEEEPRMMVMNIRVDVYRRTKEMRHPYYKGCYIFEWMGEQ